VLNGALEGPSSATKSCQGLSDASAEAHPRNDMRKIRHARKRSTTLRLYGICQKHKPHNRKSTRKTLDAPNLPILTRKSTQNHDPSCFATAFLTAALWKTSDKRRRSSLINCWTLQLFLLEKILRQGVFAHTSVQTPTPSPLVFNITSTRISYKASLASLQKEYMGKYNAHI
jgi:hypothetical protein